MADTEDQDALAAEWAAALGGADEATDAAGTVADEELAAKEQAENTQSAVDDEALAAEWAAALTGGGASEEPRKATQKNEAFSTEAKKASFVDFTDEAKNSRSEEMKNDLDFILDIPLDVSAELGRARLLINELLQLGQGSVVELNKLAGEPLEVYVNGKIIARGEAVVINEKFGIRLTDIISPIERVKQLG